MSVGQYAFYYGVTTGFALALISLLSYVPVLGTIAWLLRLLALVFLTMYFVRRYRDQFNNGVLTSGEGFLLTFLMFLYIGIIAALYTGGQIALMAAKDSQELFLLLQQTYQDAGIDIPDQTIRDVIKIVPYVVGIFYILGHLVVGAIFGAIYSSSFLSSRRTTHELIRSRESFPGTATEKRKGHRTCKYRSSSRCTTNRNPCANSTTGSGG